MALKVTTELDVFEIISRAGPDAYLSAWLLSANFSPTARTECLFDPCFYCIRTSCSWIAGMFEYVPKGEAIFMKWILHDWNDEDCLKILRNCWKALPKSGKVIIVESILPMAPEASYRSNIAFTHDLVMLTHCPGGKERTQKEFEALAIDSGFAGCEIVCNAYHTWVMEFHK
uniref:O-methyltransferase C-terminal domain-containing protein n=1 Tax=Nelumbo nucifera TaxID=4432 RepID=A0A822ZE18_NELNU|nr:TPA_asm: hypothetical protein HUJ06_016284 [Nelumbo nucifera]